MNAQNLDQQTALHGIAEITALLSTDDNGPLHLTGLQYEQISDYFARIGLNAPTQYSLPLDLNPKRKLFLLGLRSYVRSGFPVIVPLCQRLRPWAPEAERQSKLWGASQDASIRPDHAVVVVGVGKEETSARGLVVVNDPAELPFIQADEELLADAATAATLYEGWEEKEALRESKFWAATPKKVTLSLNSTHDSRTGKLRPGLFELALFMQNPENQNALRATTLRISPDLLHRGYGGTLGDLQLVQSGTSSKEGGRAINILPPAALAAIEQFLSELQPSRWVWIQHRRLSSGKGSVWVWDAEFIVDVLVDYRAPIVSKEFFGNSLQNEATKLVPAVVAMFSYNGSKCDQLRGFGRAKPSSTPVEANAPALAVSDFRKKIGLSLITSFAIAGISRAFSAWPKGIAIDLYCFMNQDCRSEGNGLHGASFLASMANSGQRVEDAVAMIQRARLSRCQEPIIGLTSFVPQLAASPQSDRAARELGFNAVKGLVMLARALRKSGEPVRTIEIVAGSRVDGIARLVPLDPSSKEAKQQFYAMRSPREKAIEGFCEQVERVVEETKLTCDDGISLAVELEPGPLYVLNDLEALELIYSSMKRRGLLDLVGFNLDIAHWRLAQITPAQLRLRPHLLASIVHAHVSEHTWGHFGDAPVASTNADSLTFRGDRAQINAIREWLNLIGDAWFSRSNLKTAPPRLIPSGYISIELEACRGIDAIERSILALKGFMFE